MTLFAGAGIATALAPNAGVLLGARVLQSLGACSGLVLGRAIVRDSATADRAAARLALLTLTMSMAPAIAPAIGGYVTALASWRASFGLLAVLGVTVLAWSFLMLPETLAREGAERSGSLLYSYARLLRSRVFCGYAIGGACSTTSFYAFMAASPFIFENLLHEPPEAIGLYYLLLMAGVAAAQEWQVRSPLLAASVSARKRSARHPDCMASCRWVTACYALSPWRPGRPVRSIQSRS
jgi:DHA1 family bicyclomycin/chloramphenicol resistance-like MFS transporter